MSCNIFAINATQINNTITLEDYCNGFARCGRGGIDLNSANLNFVLRDAFTRILQLEGGTTVVNNDATGSDIPTTPPITPLNAPTTPKGGDVVITHYDNGMCVAEYNSVTGIWETNCHFSDDDNVGEATVAGTDIYGNTYTQGDPIVTLDNGDVISLVIKYDGTVQIGSVLNLTDANRGYSLGEAEKPRNRAATLSEVDQVNSKSVSLNLWSAQQIITNRAVEAGGGMMNTDGSLGYYSKVFGPSTSFSDALLNNGAFIQKNINANESYTIPDGSYQGQRLTVYWGTSSNVFGESAVSGNFFSVLRRSSDKAITSFTVGLTGLSAVVRQGEIWDMVWGGGVWRVKATFKMFFGNNWHENIDGTSTINFSPDIPFTTNAVYSIPLPVTIINPFFVRAVITDTHVDNFQTVDGSPNNSDAAKWSFSSYFQLHTPNSISVGVRNVIPDTFIGIGKINVQIENARLDYPALGGI